MWPCIETIGRSRTSPKMSRATERVDGSTGKSRSGWSAGLTRASLLKSCFLRSSPPMKVAAEPGPHPRRRRLCGDGHARIGCPTDV